MHMLNKVQTDHRIGLCTKIMMTVATDPVNIQLFLQPTTGFIPSKAFSPRWDDVWEMNELYSTSLSVSIL